MVINTINDVVVDSIEVGAEPESMAIDKNGMIWVLCNGGWMRQNNAELIQINSLTNAVEKPWFSHQKKLLLPVSE